MGDRIRPGSYAVRARFSRSVLLLDQADYALFVVDRSIGPGPLNLVVAKPHSFVADDSLRLPRGLKAPAFDSTLPRLDGNARTRLLHILAAALPRHATPESLVSLFSPLPKPNRRQALRDALFQKAFAHFAAGHLAAGVRQIRGCGEGLTPSGDDFLCGWMLACRLRRRLSPIAKILKAARGRNPVSNAFLGMAAQGRLNRAVKNLLQAPSAARVKTACAFGHSSGADLLCGMWYGLEYPDFRIQNGQPCFRHSDF